jgi:hypothetical protein
MWRSYVLLGFRKTQGACAYSIVVGRCLIDDCERGVFILLRSPFVLKNRIAQSDRALLVGVGAVTVFVCNSRKAASLTK